MSEHTENTVPEHARVIARVVQIEGVVRAINQHTGEVRTLIVGSLIYSDEILDTSQGSVELAKDSDVTFNNDVSSILFLEALSPDLKEKFSKILKEIEEAEAEAKAKAEAEAKREGLDHEVHGPLPSSQQVSIELTAVDSQAQDSENFGGERFGVSSGSDDLPPEAGGLFGVGADAPAPGPGPRGEPGGEATVVENSFTEFNPNVPVSRQFMALNEEEHMVRQDISEVMDFLEGAHPDSMLAITVPGDSDLNDSFDDSPTPAMLPGIANPDHSFVFQGSPRTYLYSVEDLQKARSETEALKEANQENQTLVQNELLATQGLLNSLQVLQTTPDAVAVSVDDMIEALRTVENTLIFEQVQVRGFVDDADAALLTWESLPSGLGQTNGQDIQTLEDAWRDAGGAPEVMPAALVGLYEARQPFVDAVQIQENILNNILNQRDMVDELQEIENDLDNLIEEALAPSPTQTEAGVSQEVMVGLNDALDDLQLLILGLQSESQAIDLAQANGDLGLLPGVGMDEDFSFHVGAFGPEDFVPPVAIVDPNGVIRASFDSFFDAPFFVTDDTVVLVDAKANGVTTDPLGRLTEGSHLTTEVEVGPQKTSIMIDVKLMFADPDVSEDLMLEIPLDFGGH